MTKEEIIELARQAGFEEHQAKFDTRFEPFAKMVAKHTLMNIDPSKFISWQEGFEAGVAKEREACAKICDEFFKGNRNINYSNTIAICIRGRK